MPRLRANACAAAGSIWLWHELQPPFLMKVGLVFTSRSRPFWAAAVQRFARYRVVGADDALADEQRRRTHRPVSSS